MFPKLPSQSLTSSVFVFDIKDFRVSLRIALLYLSIEGFLSVGREYSREILFSLDWLLWAWQLCLSVVSKSLAGDLVTWELGKNTPGKAPVTGTSHGLYLWSNQESNQILLLGHLWFWEMDTSQDLGGNRLTFGVSQTYTFGIKKNSNFWCQRVCHLAPLKS